VKTRTVDDDPDETRANESLVDSFFDFDINRLQRQVVELIQPNRHADDACTDQHADGYPARRHLYASADARSCADYSQVPDQGRCAAVVGACTGNRAGHVRRAGRNQVGDHHVVAGARSGVGPDMGEIPANVNDTESSLYGIDTAVSHPDVRIGYLRGLGRHPGGLDKKKETRPGNGYDKYTQRHSRAFLRKNFYE